MLSSKYFNNLAVSEVLRKHWCVYCRRHKYYTHVWECMNHISQHYEQEICLQWRKLAVQYHSCSRTWGFLSFIFDREGLLTRKVTESVKVTIKLFVWMVTDIAHPFCPSKCPSIRSKVPLSKEPMLTVRVNEIQKEPSQRRYREWLDILTLISRSWISSTTTWDIPLKPPSSFLSKVPDSSEKNKTHLEMSSRMYTKIKVNDLSCFPTLWRTYCTV